MAIFSPTTDKGGSLTDNTQKRSITDSLVFKTSIFMMLMMTLVLLAISMVFILSERKRIADNIVTNGELFAKFSIPVFYDSYSQYYTHPKKEDFDTFKTQVGNTLKNNPDVVNVSMIASNGKILFDTNEFTDGKAQKERSVTDPKTLEMIESESISSRVLYTNKFGETTEIVIPIQELSGNHILSMRYLLSNISLNIRMREIYQQILLTIIPLLLLVIATAIPYAITFTRPIINLSKAAEQIKIGNFDIDLGAKSKDEIGSLSTIFEQMAKRLKNYYGDLEEEVKARTSELNESKKKVEEVNSKLQSKFDEMERMNQLMINREIKMIELKKEIEELKNNK